jgi:hypothetical protein
VRALAHERKSKPVRARGDRREQCSNATTVRVRGAAMAYRTEARAV